MMTTLARGLIEEEVPVDIVVAQKQGPYLSQVPNGARIVDLKAHRVLASLPGLVRYLSRERPHAMLSALWHANVVAVCARSMARVSMRLVLSEHSTATLSAANAEQRRARLLPVFMRLTYRKADAIIAVSEGVADDLATLLRMERSGITSIYNPIVTPKLFELAAEPVNHAWFANGEPPVILGAGRLAAAKDFQTLIRAFALVRKDRPARLMILGEGERRPELEALARQLGVEFDVALPGFVANPYKYMRKASVFVLSSRWEGLPSVLVEAMACGTPIVSTDCMSGPREILEDGRHGRLTPVGDSVSLAAAMISQLVAPSATTVVQRANAFTLDAALGKYRSALAI